MEPKVLKSNSVKEFFTPERCYISEIWNSPEDRNLSIARARVAPGVSTVLHYLERTNEWYIIADGKGRVEVGDLPPTEVSAGDVVVIPADTPQRIANTGETDLVFYCICTPRFSSDSYHEIDSG